jgi:hypothetical protein
MALWMLASLHKTTELKWPVTLHEDGSLEEAELSVFRRLFPEVRIVRRVDADRIMAERLAAYPRCADYRSRMPHALKCFDVPHFAETPRFLLLDPDVLFFSPPEEILRWVENPADDSSWFNRDFQEPSPIPPERTEAELGVKLWPQVNSGLCLLNRASVSDLDAMEEWLGRLELQNPAIQWRVEQTLLALSASKAGPGGLLPPQYEVSSSKHRKHDATARHYVGCVRDRFLSEGVYALRNTLF